MNEGKAIIGIFFKDEISAIKYAEKRSLKQYGLLKCGEGVLVVHRNQLIKAGLWKE